MKKVLLALVGAAALLVPGGGQAKEVTAVALCGPDGCATETAPAQVAAYMQSLERASDVRGAAAPGPYYRLRLTISAGEAETVTMEHYYVPGARLVRYLAERDIAQWRKAPPAERAILDPLAARVRPYGVPVVSSATVAGRRVADPSSYLALYRVAGKRTLPSRTSRVRIVLRSAVPSPWTDGANTLRLWTKDRLLERDGAFVRVPARLVQTLRAGRSLAKPARLSGR